MSPCLFSSYAEWTARLGEAQAGIRTAGRDINNFRYANGTTLKAENELKSLLMKVKKESGKSWLKAQHSKNEDHGIQFNHFMANRWVNNGNSDRQFSWVPKSLQMVTSALKWKDICSLEKNAKTNLDSVLKSRDITFPVKDHVVKDVIFLVVTCGCWVGP